MKTLMRTGILALGAAVLLTTGSAGAQATKESLKCSSSKLKLYGKDVAAQLKCVAKASAKDATPVDPACVAKAVDKTAAGFAKIEAKGGCAADASTPPIDDGTLANTRARLDAYVLAATTALVPNLGVTGNKCQTSKVKAIGKLAAALFGCESKAAGKNVAVDQVKCVDKAVVKAEQAFAKAEAKPPCDTTGDVTLQIGETQDVVRIQTVYTPRFDGCGNNLTLAPETCDDGNSENFDSCPSTCAVEFCSPTVTTRTVVLVTSRPDLSAITVDLDYPEGKIDLPGTGGSIPPGVVTTLFGSGSTNDFDHALRHVQFDAFDFGDQNIATFDFKACSGATAPVPGDFACTVVDAGQEDGLGGFRNVSGVTCSVTVLP